MQKAGFGLSNTFRSWMVLPLFPSTHTADRSLPSSGAVVIQTCLPQMTGDDQPLPWIAVFQRTFSDSDQRKGAADAAWPSAVGPRKAGQFCDGVAAREADATTSSRDRVGMVVPKTAGDNAF